MSRVRVPATPSPAFHAPARMLPRAVRVEVREVVKASEFQDRRGVSASNAKGAFRRKVAASGRPVDHRG